MIRLSCAIACTLLVSTVTRARADDPPQRTPAADAPALTVFATTAKAGGLRYTWVLPKGTSQGVESRSEPVAQLVEGPLLRLLPP